MGVVYDRRYGIRRIDTDCGARVGLLVRAYDNWYRVVCIDDYGCYVCSPDLEGDYDGMTLRTFDDLDIDEVRQPPFGDGEAI